MKTYTLNTTQDKMPAIGLGTWKSAEGEVGEAVKAAVRAGYRHIDCAPIYGNEAEIGKALQELFAAGEVRREDLWITSKLWNDAHRKEDVIPALKKTLSDLQLDYLDLFLIHWPVAQRKGVALPESPNDFVSLEEVPLSQTWQGMEEAVREKLTRNIGVSNFSWQKLVGLTKAASIPPAVNQVELHPFLAQNALLEFCRQENILLTAYSPLGSGDRPSGIRKADEPRPLSEPTVLKIAQKHGVSPAQVLIQWAVARGTAVIPKSTNPSRIKENLSAAQLSLDTTDIEQLNALDKHYRIIDGSFWTPEGSPYTLATLWDE